MAGGGGAAGSGECTARVHCTLRTKLRGCCWHLQRLCRAPAASCTRAAGCALAGAAVAWAEARQVREGSPAPPATHAFHACSCALCARAHNLPHQLTFWLPCPIMPALNPGGGRPGDWVCACGNNNYAFRTSCHKCGSPKDGKRSGSCWRVRPVAAWAAPRCPAHAPALRSCAPCALK